MRLSCRHLGELVPVGPYQVQAAGTMYLRGGTILEADTVVSLNGLHPTNLWGEIIDLELPDFGGVPADWRSQLETIIIPRLEAGATMLAFCSASHGRTGTFLASLIALLESEGETPDPIAAVRRRHCFHSVETVAQAGGIFDLRDQPVPGRYTNTLIPNGRLVGGPK